MAFYYSKRKLRPRDKEEMGELNIVPYLDILMNLIIFLLASITGLASLGILNVNAPNYGPASGVASGDQPQQQQLLLTVAISQKGFYVAATGGVLGQAAEGQGQAQPGQGEPTIPRKADGQYDFAALTQQMVQIKQAFPSETKVIVAADRDIEYETLIATMDALRETPGPNRRLLFPDVTLGTF